MGKLRPEAISLEENSRMGKTRDLFKKTGVTKGLFHAKIGTVKDKSDKDLKEPYLPGSCPPEALSLGMMTGCPGKVLGGFKPPAAVIEQCFNPLQKGLRCA